MNESATDASLQINSDVQSFRFLGIGIGVCSIIIGTSGNLLTIMSVLRNAHLRRSSFNMFIVNLSIIDLLTALVMMPFNVMGYSLMRWPFSEKACILQAFFYFSCGYTSVVCLISITLNRFLGIVFPDRYTLFFTENMVRIWIFFSWLIAPAFLLPFFVSSLINSVRGDQLITGWRSDQFLCTFVSMPSNWVQYMQVVRFLFQFFPSIMMSVSYAVMVYYVHKSNRRMDANSPPDYILYQQRMRKKLSSATVVHCGDDCRTDCDCSVIMKENISMTSENNEKPKLSRSQSGLSRISLGFLRAASTDVENENSVTKLPAHVQRRHDNENHLVYVSIIICLVFTLLFLPSVVLNLIPGNQKFDPRFHMMASNITWLNCCMNPFVYVFFHKGMRKEYKKLIKLLRNKIRDALKIT